MLRKTGISPYIPRFWGAFGGFTEVCPGSKGYPRFTYPGT